MLKKLKLKNFQGHRNSSLKFSPGVNVIVGKTQSGKTALLRSIRKCAFNRPLGSFFQNKFAGESLKIKLITDDNYVVTFLKNKKESIYKLKSLNSKSTKTFRKFKSSVPEDIVNVLNLNQDFTYQDQLDPYFLINSSSSVFEKKINSLLNIEEIENWRSIAKEKIKKKKVILSEFSSRISSSENFLKKYKDLGPIKELIGRHKGIVSDISVKCQYLVRLKEFEKYIKNLNRLEKRTKGYRYFYKNFLHISDVKDEDAIKKKKKDYLYLSRCIKDLDALNSKILKWKTLYVNEFKKRKICPLCFSKVSVEKLKKEL